jgi:tape measure domain-containing protein
MSTSRANLETVVSADSSQFTATMRRVGMNAQATSTKISKSMNEAGAAVARFGAATVAAGASLAAAGVAAALFKGIKGAAQIEQMSIAFEVMTGSAEKGKKVLDDIRKYGAATPYEFPALAKGVQTMLSFGIATEDVMPALKMLGDVASGDAQKMERLSVVYSQISAKGRLMGDDLMQLIESGFNPLTIISEKTGESMTDLYKRMEQGKISFAEVTGAFVTATSEGGKFFEMTARQGATFNGVMSSLSDSVSASLARMAEPIIAVLVPEMQKAIQIIEQLTPTLDGLGANTAEHLTGITGKIAEFASGIYGVYLEFDRIGALIGATFGAIFSTDYWGGVTDIIGGALLKPLAMFEEAHRQMMARLMGKEVEGNSGPIAKAADAMSKRGEKTMDPFNKAFEDIINKPGQKLSEFNKAIAGGLAGKPQQADGESAQGGGAGDQSEQSKPSLGLADKFKGKGPQSKGPAGAFSVEKSKNAKAHHAYGDEMGPSRDQMTPRFDAAGPSRGLMNRNVSKFKEKRDAAEAAGFKGLGGLYGMQMEKAMGIGVGEGGLFAKERASKGIASGLVTGGLGEKRRLKTSKDENGDKKNLSLQEQQAEHLRNIEGNIKSALTAA